MLKFKRLPYYFSSFSEVLKQEDYLRHPWHPSSFFFMVMVARLLFNWPVIIRFKKLGLNYKIATPLDLLTLKEVVLDEDYESLVAIEQGDKIVVDVGAGFGDFAILTAKKHPRTKIFAIEPDPFYFELLKKNIKLNNVSNVFVSRKAVTSLEDIFDLGPQITNIDFLKMDCEGCEFSIFENAERESLMRIKKIALEYHLNCQHRLSDLEKVFEEGGFKIETSQREWVEEIGLLGAER